VTNLKNSKKKWLIYGFLGVMGVVVIIGIGFTVWATDTNPVMEEAIAALRTSDAVRVDRNDWIIFSPVEREPGLGVIFYPGGRVDPKAYAPGMRRLAENGYLAIIVPMPLNLAFLDANRAAEVINAYPEIDTWVIGGHSLGGAMAASYVYTHPDQLDGLFLWASYTTESGDLSATQIPVLAIYASEDGLVEGEQGIEFLPATTEIIHIEGGNHAQFGYYGMQEGDGLAKISWASQQEEIINAMLAFLMKLSQ